MEDGALTSCPSLGSWHEVGEVEGSLVGVWCPGSLLGLGLTGDWLAGLVPGCVIREEKGCIVGASKDCYALTRRWLHQRIAGPWLGKGLELAGKDVKPRTLGLLAK